jgi:hypothetical protein
VIDSTGPDKDFGVTIFIDANTLAFGAAVSPPAYGLADLIQALPDEAKAFLGWIPNVSIDIVALTFDPASMAFSVYGSAGLADSAKPSASLLIASADVTGGPPGASFVVAVSLDSSIELSGVPLFGSTLSGISVSNLQFSYASYALPAGTIVLPPPAPPPPPYVQGPQLSFLLSDGTNQQSFTLTPSSGTKTPRQLGAADRPSRTLVPMPAAGDDPPPPGPPIQWFDVQKSIGPLTIGRIGVVTGDDELGIALDASLQTTALSVDLTGFTLGFSPTSDISLSGLRISLDGLAVSFSSSAVQIVGSLLRTVVEVDQRKVTEYNGAIMIQAGVYAIAAIGSFAEIDGHPSLFIFGMVKGEFGGPPAFFVTGLAAGFGVNRGLRLPTPDQVQDFPFVLMATMGGSYLPDPSTNNALSKLTGGGWVPPELGSYWLAAGIQFTSFQLLNAFALLIVRFGNEFVVALLGIASISLPKGIGQPYAYAELTLDAVLDPAQGTFQMMALLTPNSFVLYQDCRLTGGFAFYLWFGSNDHAGDFVVTLGGYNSAFTKPDWYPDVPRLGICWKVSSEIQISGGAYFALTPSCIMAGGALSLRFDAGNLKAWFDAHADFIIWWQPFFFDVSIGVSIGASYTLDLGFVRKTLTVSLSADVELWGPPLAGVAHVSWYVISFTIAINGGGRPNLPGKVIDWDTFESTFLPTQPGAPETDRAELAEATSSPNSPVCRPRAAAGLASTLDQDGTAVWQVIGDQFVLGTETLIPATSIVIQGPTPATTLTFDGPAISAYPMGKVSLSSTHTLQIFPIINGQRSTVPFDLSGWTWAPLASSVPSAMWGSDNTGSAELSASTVPGLTGINGTPPPPPITGPSPFQIAALKWVDLGQRPLPLDTAVHDGSTPPPKVDPRTAVGTSIGLNSTIDARATIAQALNLCGIGVELVGGQMSLFAADLDLTLPQEPMLGPVGSTGPRPVVTTGVSAAATVGVPPRAATPARPVTAAGSPPVRATTPNRFPTISRTFTRTGRQARCSTYRPDATRRQRSTIANSQNDPRCIDVDPSGVVVIDVDMAVHRSLHAGDGPPVNVWMLDRSDRPLGQFTLTAGADGALDLPDGTCRVAVGADAATTGGWRSADDLIQVAPHALIVGSILVRPQAPQALRPRQRRGRPGVLSSRALATDNWVETAVGRRRGWVDCWLPTGTRHVEVTVCTADEISDTRTSQMNLPLPDPTGTQLWVGFGWSADTALVPLTWNRVETADPAQQADLTGGRATTLAADLPAGAGAARIRLTTASEWRLAGVTAPAAEASRRITDPTDDQYNSADPAKPTRLWFR